MALENIRRGDTYAFEIKYDIDITDYQFWFSLKTNITDSTPVLEFVSTTGEHPADDAATGFKVMEIPSTTTKALTVGKYFYDVQAVILGTNPLNVTTIYPPPDKKAITLEVLPDVTIPDSE